MRNLYYDCLHLFFHRKENKTRQERNFYVEKAIGCKEKKRDFFSYLSNTEKLLRDICTLLL